MPKQRSRRVRKWIVFGLLLVLFCAVIVGAALAIRRGLRKEDPYAKAVEALRSGDRDLAERRLREVLEANPSNRAALATLIEVLVDRGEMDEAKALAERATQDPDSELVGWRALVQIAIRSLDFDGAVRMARSIADRDPLFAQGVIMQVHDALGTPGHREVAAAAALTLASLTDSWAMKANAYLFAAETYADLQRFTEREEARARLARAAAHAREQGDRALMNTSEWASRSPEARLQKARFDLLSSDTGAADQGRAELTALLESRPEEYGARDALLAHLCRQDDWDTALTLAQDLREGPILLWVRAARRFASAGRADETLALLENAPEGEHPGLDLLRAQVWLREDADEDSRAAAVALLRELVAKQGDDPNIVGAAYRLLVAAGETEAAMGILDAVGDRSPEARTQARAARAVLAMQLDPSTGHDLVQQLAEEVTNLPESVQVLASLKAGASDETVRSYLDALVATGGERTPQYYILRAATLAAMASSGRSAEDAEDLWAAVRADLAALVDLEGATKDTLAVGWRLARLAKSYALGGQLCGRAMTMDGSPEDLTFSVVAQSLNTADDVIRREVAEGMEAVAPHGAEPEFVMLLARLVEGVEGDLPSTLDALTPWETKPSTAFAALMVHVLVADRGGDAVGALDAAQRLVALRPDAPAARVQYGVLLAQSEQWEAILELYSDKDLTPREYIQRIMALRQLERDDEAMQQGRMFVQSFPNLALAYLALAELHEAAGRPDAALGVLSAAPGSSRDVLLQRARILMQRGELALAEGIYGSLIGASRGMDVEAWRALAAVRKEQGRQGEFLTVLNDFIGASSPSLARASLGSLLVIRGMTREGLRDYAGAIQDYEHALSLGSEEVPALNNLAWLILTQERGRSDRDERLAKALDLAVRAVERVPGMAGVHHTLASLNREVGRLDEAEASMRDALELLSEEDRPEKTVRYTHQLAEILAGLGKVDEAIQALANALEQYPRSPREREAKDLLESLRRR